MKRSLVAMSRLGAAATVGLQLSCVFAAPLEAGISSKVRAATFEVVVPKPEHESVVYDKDWHEALPFQLRSDKYVSIGTAFAIGPNQYATAMHVLVACFGDARGEPSLRDAAGNLYPIDQITKGSIDKDFAIFRLAKPPEPASFLELNDAPELNETVYAVGNALGEGIVMREGNYTSDTPEEESGRWKWMRFSAPISGGNSGGPLLDGKGRVIGIVRAMRTTENTLNIAVPVAAVVSTPTNMITVDTRTGTGFSVFEKIRPGRFKAEIRGPKSFTALASAYMKLVDDYDATQLRSLLSENEADTFPQGRGSERLLHSFHQKSAPGIAVQNGSGAWLIAQPTYTRLDLGHDGWQDSASFKGYSIFHRHKPEDLDQSSWYTDAKAAREVVLKASPSAIHVSSETAKVMSLGSPSEDSLFTDVWGRVWQVRSWRVTTWFGSDWLLEFDLPVPDGSVGFETRASNLARAVQIDRMKQLTGFFATSYEGKLAQWQAFLRHTDLLPRALAQSFLNVDYGERFAFDDHRVAFTYGPDLQRIDKSSRLRLDLAFMHTAEADRLAIAGVVAYNPEDRTEIDVFRHADPGESGNDASRTDWRRRVQHAHPYDAVSLTANDRQMISTVMDAPGQPVHDVLYTFQYRAEPGTTQDRMKEKLDMLTQRAVVNDNH